MTRDVPTTILLAILALTAISGCVALILRLLGTDDRPGLRAWQRIVFVILCIGCPALMAYRLILVHQSWAPLESHADGLILLATLIGPTVAYLQARARFRGLTGFALPVLAFILAWAICASWWTIHPFSVGSMWKAFHLATVYIGAASLALSAAAGTMYLHVQRMLRLKKPTSLQRLASLEALERLMIASAAVGFGLLTVALVSGLIIITSGDSDMGAGWWHSPKIILGTAAWLIYGLLVNVRHASSFRGSRAAWLSIAGLLLMMATFAVVVSALPRHGETSASPASSPVDQETA
ncbi:MAG: cytochrome c biogenesis protein CcsA [Phycisphaeraceae bacterium]|nr:cytochrome c biogenesis protein CcsA [Phycisphaeraceae bacterium]